MKGRTLAIIIAIIASVIIGGGYAYKLYEKEKESWGDYTAKLEGANLDLNEKNLALLDTLETWKINMEEKEAAFEAERLRWMLEMQNLNDLQKVLSDNITKYKEEKDRLEKLLADAGNGNTDEYDRIVKERNKLEALISAEIRKNHELQQKINTLKSQVELSTGNALAYMNNMNEAIIEIREELLRITRMSDHLGYQATMALNSGTDTQILYDIENNVRMVKDDIQVLRSKLAGIEERMARNEEANDSIFDMSRVNKSFRNEVQSVYFELQNREAQSDKTTIAVNTRYLLVAPTDTLVNWGLLKKRRGFLKKGYDFTNDFSKVDKSYCTVISKLDKVITIPYNKETLKGVRSMQADHSFTIEPSNTDPGVSEIVFYDKEEFYKDSFYVVVEID